MKKQHYIIIALILLIFGGAFYWYEVRPSQIRKKCIQSANTESNKAYFNETAYKKCLMENGIKE